MLYQIFFFFFQAEDGIRDVAVTGVQTCALPIYRSLAEMVADPAIDALWGCGPNFARIDNFEEIADSVARGKGELRGIACEKPLGRNVAEAKRVLELTKKAGIAHGYLENQALAPAVAQGRAIIWARGATLTGRPYLARAAEEHSGPHMPWFWQGKLQGGGVLNDMMGHSSLVVRHLLTPPDAPLASVRPARVTGHIASLKWSRCVLSRAPGARMRGARRAA